MRSGHNCVATEARKGKVYSSFLRVSMAVLIISQTSSCVQNGGEKSVRERAQNEGKIQLNWDANGFNQTVELTETGLFGENNDHFLEGFINDYEIDEYGRIYIVTSSMDKTGISVFDDHGAFLQKIGRKGRGPGDFQGITDIIIRDELLHVFDFNLKRISVYELDTFTLLRTVILEQTPSDEVLMDFSMLHVNGNGSYVMGLMEPLNLNKDGARIMYIRLRDPTGKMIQGNLIDLRLPEHYISDERPGPGFVLPFTTPFSRKTLIDFNNQDHIYSTWSDQIMIHVMDPGGQLIQEMRYPYENPMLDIDELEMNKSRLDVLEKYDMPERWPALYELVVSENKLWMAVFTHEYREFKWFVFDEDGEPIAEFMHRGKHENIEPGMIPKRKIRVKNGFFYEHEFDFDRGIDRIVKYRIEFREAR